MKKNRVLVWDLPTRVCHWMLAASFAIAFATSDTERWRDVHLAAGYSMGAVLAFRIAWGWFGTRYARFDSFVVGPARVFGYLRSMFEHRAERFVGHNPAGGWAILALLGGAGALVVSGAIALFAADSEAMTEVHEAMAYAMLGLIGIHLAGVTVGSIMHRENLVRSMIDGLKRAEPAAGARGRAGFVAVALVVAVGAICAATVVRGPGQAPAASGGARIERPIGSSGHRS